MTDDEILDPASAAKPRARAGKTGYSLVEILVALAIIAVLAILIAPKLLFLRPGVQAKAAHDQLVMLRRSLEFLKLDTGRYPTQQEGLTYLVRPPKGALPNWNGPYFQGGLPRDPWGRLYVYTAPGPGHPRPTISSLGRDGKPGGTGRDADIVSD